MFTNKWGVVDSFVIASLFHKDRVINIHIISHSSPSILNVRKNYPEGKLSGRREFEVTQETWDTLQNYGTGILEHYAENFTREVNNVKPASESQILLKCFDALTLLSTSTRLSLSFVQILSTARI